MRKHLIEAQLKTLRATFDDGLPPVPREMLQSLFRESDYTGMVRLIRDGMHLDLRIRVGLAKSPTKAPAWVEMPSPTPQLGSAEFSQTLATIFLSKAFLAEATFEQAVMAIAHEMAQIVLNGLRHPLRGEETAVDLTAMLLGFRDFYIQGCQIITFKRLRGGEQKTIHSLGYLTKPEVLHAGGLLGYSRAWWKSEFLKKLTPLFSLIGLFTLVSVALSAKHNLQWYITSVSREFGRAASLPSLAALVALVILACFTLYKFRWRKTPPLRNYWKPHRERSTPHETQREKVRDDGAKDSSIHRTFLNVFAIMSQDRRQALVGYYQKKFNCNASAAMRMAIDDYMKEARRYG